MGLVLGLIVLFRQLIHRTGPVLLAMVAASYAAYILHLTIVISIQAGMTRLDVPALVKFGIVTVLGVALAFGLAHLSRRVPGLRVILGTTPAQPDEASRVKQPSG